MEYEYQDMDIPAMAPSQELPVPLDLRFSLDYEPEPQRLSLHIDAGPQSCAYGGRGRILVEGGYFRVPPLSLLDPFLSQRRYIDGRHMKIVLRILLPKLARDGLSISCPLELREQPACTVTVHRVENDTVFYSLTWQAPRAILRDLAYFDRHVIAGNVIYQGAERHLLKVPYPFSGSYTASGAQAQELGKLAESAGYLFAGDGLASLRLLGRGEKPDEPGPEGADRAPGSRLPSSPARPARVVPLPGPVLVSVSVQPHPRPSAARYAAFVGEAKRLSALIGHESPFVPFSAYWPTYDSMTRDQRAWYFYWRSEFDAGSALKTDLSYLFIALYECINRAAGSPPDSLSRMLRLWKSYRGAFPRLDRYVPGWCLDFILVNRLEVPFESIFAETLPDCAALQPFPEVYFAHSLEKGLYALPFEVLCSLSSYSPIRSRFYPGHEEQLARGAAAALRALEAQIARAKGAPLTELLAPEPQTVAWDSYRGAVCGRAASRRLALTYRPLSHSVRLRSYLGDVLRHVENLLRRQAGFPGRLRCASLSQATAAVIGHALAAPSPEAPAGADAAPLPIDLEKALTLEADSWETTRRLLEASGAAEEWESAPSGEGGPEPDGPELPAPDGAAEEEAAGPSEDPWRAFLDRLSPLERSVLKALHDGAGGGEVAALAAAEFTFPDAVYESVNEAFLDGFGDLLIDTAEPAHILEDYREALEAAFDSQVPTANAPTANAPETTQKGMTK